MIVRGREIHRDGHGRCGLLSISILSYKHSGLAFVGRSERSARAVSWSLVSCQKTGMAREVGMSDAGVNAGMKGLAWLSRERVMYVMGILGNRRRSDGDGVDVVRLCRSHVPQGQDVARSTERRD